MYIPFGFIGNLQVDIDYIIVAGGGSGGNILGGGGGAGGVITGSNSIPIKVPHQVVIGQGGTPTNDGENSSFYGFASIGGGAAGSESGSGNNGGSGGGAGGQLGFVNTGGQGTSTQGNNGGNSNYQTFPKRVAAGGGGGYSESGGNGHPSLLRPGAGGQGIQWLNGMFFAGGGGGGGYNTRLSESGSGGAGGGGRGKDIFANGDDGQPNTGGGGGGAGRDATDSGSIGGSGGSGVVIIRYKGKQSGTGGTVYQTDEYTYHQFNNSGVFELSEYPTNSQFSSFTEGSLINAFNYDTGSFYNILYQVPSKLDNIQTTGVSLEIWAKNPSLTQTYDAFIGLWNGLSVPSREWIEIRQQPNNTVIGQIYHNNPIEEVNTSPSSSVADANEFWHHMLTYDPTSGDLLYYRNGNLEGSGSGSLSSDDYQFVYVGQQEDGFECDMYVGEYRIYTSSLDASDVLYNFNGTKTRYGY